MSPLARVAVSLLVALAIAGGPGCGLASTSRNDASCAQFAPTIAGRLPQPVPVAKFEGIDATWTLPEVFARLGAAQRRIPAASYDFEWIGDDGSLFEVSSATKCGVVTRAGFVAGRH